MKNSIVMSMLALSLVFIPASQASPEMDNLKSVVNEMAVNLQTQSEKLSDAVVALPDNEFNDLAVTPVAEVESSALEVLGAINQLLQTLSEISILTGQSLEAGPSPMPTDAVPEGCQDSVE